MSAAPQQGAPRQTLSITDAVAIIVGLIVGAGIFGTPSIVAVPSIRSCLNVP